MKILKEWPQNIIQYITENHGQPIAIEKLNGIKDEGGCYRLSLKDTSIIIKLMTEAREYYFYTRCTKYMKAARKSIPELYWSFQEGARYWCILEDIAYPFPRDRWKADEGVIDFLATFHFEMWQKKLPMEDYYKPQWTNDLTEAVLDLYPTNVAKNLKPSLINVQENSQQLFKEQCWINGDTNPTNWGVRRDGSVVLFDWERISIGSPAIDLAITLPGLGTEDNSLELLLSKRYLKAWSKLDNNPPLPEEILLMHVNYAKVWSVVEFLANSSNLLSQEGLEDVLDKLSQKIYLIKP